MRPEKRVGQAAKTSSIRYEAAALRLSVTASASGDGIGIAASADTRLLEIQQVERDLKDVKARLENESAPASVHTSLQPSACCSGAQGSRR